MYTVIYDGACAVCSRIVETWRGWDREERLEIVPSQALGVRDRFPQIPWEDYDDSLQVVGADGRVWNGGAAVARVLQLLPRARALGRILGSRPLRGLTDRLYAVFARHRHRFGCSQHCALDHRRPPTDGRARRPPSGTH
ncbi:MAG: DUF393 domain-containing protein [Acidobacteriota bacterium]